MRHATGPYTALKVRENAVLIEQNQISIIVSSDHVNLGIWRNETATDPKKECPKWNFEPDSENAQQQPDKTTQRTIETSVQE